jgi:hypothetical protein
MIDGDRVTTGFFKGSSLYSGTYEFRRKHAEQNTALSQKIDCGQSSLTASNIQPDYFRNEDAEPARVACFE